MMVKTITRLEAQKRNPNRVNIHLDGEYAFALEKIVAAWLYTGQTLSDEKILELQSKDSLEKVYNHALRMITRRNHSRQEVMQKLRMKGFSDPEIEAVIDRLQNASLLDDTAFARQWVENRTTFRPRSHRALAFELRRKGLAGAEIESALSAAESDDVLAYRLGSKYAARLDRLDQESFREKLYAYLGRYGFSYGVITPVYQKLWQELRARQKSESENEEF